jgi:hypothetical protein
MIQICVAPSGESPQFIFFNGVVITDGHPVPHAKLLPRSRLQELDVQPEGVLFVFELSEVEVRCTKQQSDEIVEHMLDRRLSAVRVDENPREHIENVVGPTDERFPHEAGSRVVEDPHSFQPVGENDREGVHSLPVAAP